MKEIIDSEWFNTMRGSIGIVIVKTLTGWKSYIWIARGLDEDEDCQDIADYGSKIKGEVAVIFFPYLKIEEEAK